MKKIKYLVIAFIAAGLLACGPKENSSESSNENTEKSNSTQEENAVDLSNMMEIDLTDYGFTSSFFIPKDKGKPEIAATDWGSIEIRIGKNYGLEIMPNGISIEERKAELAADIVYNYTYLEDKMNLIVYEQSIPDSDVKPETHFFFNMELNGELVEVRSLQDMSFNKRHVEVMVSSAKALSSKTTS